MEILDALNQKVRKAADDLLALKQERSRLTHEIERLRLENKDLFLIRRENERLQRERNKLRAKLERLSKKIERSISAELQTAASAAGGPDHEERPQ